ncbi:MAG: TolC family protein [Acidobacteria bacterium]|nr:TolC family protein [Acidobacteriota bacterium]
MTVRLLLLAAASIHAQPLTMDEAVTRALASHPDLTAARAARAVAAFQIQAARALPTPEFKIIANNFSLDPDISELRNSVAWTWVPPRPRELRFKTEVAQARQRSVDAEIRTAEARIAAAVRHAYRRAALAAERAELAAAMLALRGSVVEVTRRQVATGLKEAVEVDLAELAHADAEAAHHRLQSAAGLERRRLARLLDPSGALNFTLVKEFAPAVSPAQQNRPELAQAAAACEQSDAATRLANNAVYPWLSSAQVTRRIGAASGRPGAWGFQVGVELPIFRSAAKGEARVASAAARQCRLLEQALQLRVRQELEEATAQWQAATAELDKLDRLSKGPAARALEHTRAALAEGRADRGELLLAEARQLSLRDRWLERRIELTALELQLELAAGF